MLKIIFLLVLFSPDGTGYQDFVGETPTMEQCEEMVVKAHAKFKGTPQRYVVACLPVKGGLEI